MSFLSLEFLFLVRVVLRLFLVLVQRIITQFVLNCFIVFCLTIYFKDSRVKRKKFDKKSKKIMKKIEKALADSKVKISAKKSTFVACKGCHKSIQLTIRLED